MRKSSILDNKVFNRAGAVAEETINNIKTIASFAHFDFEIDRYKEGTSISLKYGLKVAMLTGLVMGFLFFTIYSSYTLAIWFGSTLIFEQERNPQTHEIFRAGDVILVLFTVVF